MSHIIYSAADGIATITLNRPEKLNAFAGSMRDDLSALLDRAAADAGIRVVVITGAGRAFCAGGDVETMRALQAEKDVDGFRALLEAGARVVSQIASMPKLVIAAVNGVAAGAGCNLALACDFRIASEAARFAESFVKIGVHPDWGGTWFLPRIVGSSRALELLLTGRTVDAAEAHAIGLVDRVVEAAWLIDETMAFARHVAAGPPVAMGDIKRAVRASAGNDLAAQLDLETRHQLRAFASEDAAEGMRAFAEKRSPQFRGA